MSSYFAYTRVSTEKQGEGVSLVEQRAAIQALAGRMGVEITRWFEERQTAAKKGRPVFGEMMRLLRSGRADGLLMHRIDRSARNLRDWVAVGDLADDGIDVRFVIDQVDLNTRGGRITADIQAVIAADYVRNLREESLKGIYGRYKQGLLPLPAPIGYLDCGGGKPKEIDPLKGPLVKEAFELYATGEYSLESLRQKMHERGLRNTRDGPITKNNIAHILRNRFYAGTLVYKRTGELFEGQHAALVTKKLFETVQGRLNRRAVKGISKHNFLYRRLLRCALCSRFMVGERQKGRVYYRCHNRACETTTVREDVLESHIQQHLRSIKLDDELVEEILREAESLVEAEKRESETNRRTQAACLAKAKSQLSSLTAAFVSREIDQLSYDVTKADLIERIEALDGTDGKSESDLLDEVRSVLELFRSAQLSYESGNRESKLDTVKSTCSNLTVARREPFVELRNPFRRAASSPCVLSGAPDRGGSRTLCPKQLAQLTIDEAIRREEERRQNDDL